MEKSKAQEIAAKQLDRVLAFFARVEAKASYGSTIYNRMIDTVKVYTNGRQMWEARSWTPVNDRRFIDQTGGGLYGGRNVARFQNE